MTTFFLFQPEMPGRIGEDASISRDDRGRMMSSSCSVVIESWEGGELLHGGADVYIASERLAQLFIDHGLTGLTIVSASVTLDEQFRMFFPDDVGRLPAWKGVEFRGLAARDDFGLDDRNQLVVSEAALAVLRGVDLGFHSVMSM